MSGNDSYTVSLLHLDTDYTDSALSGTHTWTGYGDAQIDTVVKKFGAGSLLLDGIGDYLDTPDSADWAMGSGDFTVDFWMKRSRYSVHETLIGQGKSDGTNSNCGITIYLNSVPLDGQTVSLLHMNGANNATSIIDSCRWRAHAWTFNGDAKLSTTSPKFGTASLYCDGTGDYIDTPDNADWTMGSGDFTVEMWVKRGRTLTLERLTGQMDSVGNNSSVSFGFRFNADDTMLFNVGNGTSLIYTSTATKVSDTTIWHHLAMVRYGNTINMYIDGIADANTLNVTGVTINDSAYKLAIGRIGEYVSGTFQGYIDEYRISKGVARWTGNFSVPTGEYIYDRLQAGFCVGSGGYGITGTTDISDTNWHHVELDRSGNTMYLFLDGVSEGTVDVTGQTMNNSTYKMAIGAEGEYVGSLFAGNIDESRISKGIARHTTGFTPPTGPYGQGLTSDQSDTITLSDSRMGQPGLSKSDSISLSDGFSNINSFKRTLTDNIILSDIQTDIVSFVRSISDSFTLSDFRTSSIQPVFADIISPSDLTLKLLSLPLSDLITLSDEINTLLEHLLSLSDMISVSDEISTIGFVKLISDIISLGDTILKKADFIRSFSDIISIKDFFESNWPRRGIDFEFNKFKQSIINLPDGISFEFDKFKQEIIKLPDGADFNFKKFKQEK